MYNEQQLEQAEKFTMEVLDYRGFQDIVDKDSLNFWMNEIERIENAKRFYNDIEILLATQTTVFDPWEGMASTDPIY